MPSLIGYHQVKCAMQGLKIKERRLVNKYVCTGDESTEIFKHLRILISLQKYYDSYHPLESFQSHTGETTSTKSIKTNEKYSNWKFPVRNQC